MVLYSALMRLFFKDIVQISNLLKTHMGFDQRLKGCYGTFFALEVGYKANVSSVSPSSGQRLSLP